MLALSVACSGVDEPFDLEQYTADNLQWRADRLERLRGPTGYLNLAGLGRFETLFDLQTCIGDVVQPSPSILLKTPA